MYLLYWTNCDTMEKGWKKFQTEKSMKNYIDNNFYNRIEYEYDWIDFDNTKLRTENAKLRNIINEIKKIIGE